MLIDIKTHREKRLGRRAKRYPASEISDNQSSRLNMIIIVIQQLSPSIRREISRNLLKVTRDSENTQKEFVKPRQLFGLE